MYDLETLRFLNEQAVARQRMMTGEPLVIEDELEPVFPLAMLAHKLIAGPPSLAHVIDRLLNYESVAEFLDLIREYLPEHETAIMAQMSDTDKIRMFMHHFANRYFPLADSFTYIYDETPLGDFTRDIPINLMGLSFSDYHEAPTSRDGFILIIALLEPPWGEDDARIPILEAAADLVGEGLISHIPEGGFRYHELYPKLDNTDYDMINAVVDWIFSSTDCWQLDANYEDGYEMVDWSRYYVDNLTEQWPRVREYHERMTKAYEWLEEDLKPRFKELLEFILDIKIAEKGTEIIPKEQMPLPLDENAQVLT